MKRHALLLGYSGWDLPNGFLSGVMQDLQNYKEYLMSLRGGGWDENEITVLEDKSLTKENIQAEIKKIKRNGTDVVFTVFSGHGEYDDVQKSCRILEISRDAEIPETDLWNLAKRQILILDSCSGLRSRRTITEARTALDKNSKQGLLRDVVRYRYEKLCEQCPEQQIRLYAAKKGSYAKDTDDGGLYSKVLLGECSGKNNNSDINAVTAHDRVAQEVKKETHEEQVPDKLVPRVHPFLPIAVKI